MSKLYSSVLVFHVISHSAKTKTIDTKIKIYTTLDNYEKIIIEQFPQFVMSLNSELRQNAVYSVYVMDVEGKMKVITFDEIRALLLAYQQQQDRN